MPRPTNVPDLLDMAADRIERYGWTQEDYFRNVWNGDGFWMPPVILTKCLVCAAGAINYAGGAPFDEDHFDGLRRAAVVALVEHLGLDVSGWDVSDFAEVGALGDWNDAEDRTAEEVVTALRECAAAERTVCCANEDHTRKTPAVARLAWPDGRYRPTTACATDLRWQVRESVREGHTVIVEPVDDADPTFQEVGSLRRQVEQLQAKLDRHHDELRDKRTDLLEIRGILKPADRMEPVVPMPLGHMVAPAVEWLADDRGKALDALSSHGRAAAQISGSLQDGIDTDHRIAAAEREGLLEEIANLRAALNESESRATERGRAS